MGYRQFPGGHGVTMSFSRLMALIRKEFLQIRRDPRTLILVIVIPIMQMFLLGYSATNDVRNVPLIVLDQDRSPQARALLDAYRAADYFRVTAKSNRKRNSGG
jgi:ABC-2 type transport system permease protein